MTRRSCLPALIAVAVLAAANGAQCTLSTGFPGGNSFNGNWFDVVNLTPNLVRMTSLDINVAAGVQTVQVFVVTCGGTFVGKHNVPALWTQVGNFAGVIGAGVGLPTVLPPFPTPVDLLPGVNGIYVFSSASMTYSNGTAVGNVIAADANLQIQTGYGGAGNFPAAFNSARNWNGVLHYDCISPGPPPGAEFQVNQPGAGLLVNNTVGGSCAGTVVNQTVYNCAPIIPATGTVAFSSNNLLQAWDLAFSNAGLVPATAGGLTLPDGEVINLNFASTITFLNGFLGATLPGGIFGQTTVTLSFAYALSTQTDVSLQGVAVNPAALTGIDLSQASELHVNLTNAPTSFTTTLADNATVGLNVAAPPYCWATAGIPFYGVNYTTMYINSNGRVNFGTAGITTAAPTTTLFASNNPSVGVWTDWNPAILGGTIVATNMGGGIVRVDYSVAYAGETLGTLQTFGIQFDSVTGSVMIDGLNGITPNPQGTAGGAFLATADSMLMGISRGNTGATNGGLTTTFTSGGAGTPANTTDMWYDFYAATNPGAGLCPSLVGGTLSTLIFTPNGTFAPNYDWNGF